ncbi:MAG: hypothetical protein KJ042_18305 [Deltaproteobacteria bacterium]|nr:hypothetical protein [Deltaproteobacteria bacterium]
MRPDVAALILAISWVLVAVAGCAGDDDDDSNDDDTGDDDTADDDVTDDDTGDDDTTTTTTTTTTVETTTTTTTIPDLEFEDFESYTLGQNPTGPWSIFEFGANNIEIVDGVSKDGEGKFLQYGAGIGVGDYGNAAMDILVDEDATFSFDLYRTAGASTHFMMTMNDGSWLEEVILNIDGTTGKLFASTPSDGDLEGRDVPDDEWFRISVDFLFVEGRFDVLVNDEVTDCDDFDALHNAQQPFQLLQWMDYDDAGYGGTYYVDNIRVRPYD